MSDGQPMMKQFAVRLTLRQHRKLEWAAARRKTDMTKLVLSETNLIAWIESLPDPPGRSRRHG